MQASVGRASAGVSGQQQARVVSARKRGRANARKSQADLEASWTIFGAAVADNALLRRTYATVFRGGRAPRGVTRA